MNDSVKRVIAGTSALAFVMGLLSACGGKSRLKVGEVEGGEVIEAIGMAPYEADDVIGTKRKSLADAQKQAVERVVGVMISARTRVEKAIMIDQNILARTRGYIQKYDILKEEREGDIYKTWIRALVMTKQIEEDLDQMGLLKSVSLSYPRVAILVTEKSGGQERESTITSDAFSGPLLARGYKVVDRSALMAAKAYDSLMALDEGDTSLMAELAKNLKAEVLIMGEAESQELPVELGGMVSYRAVLTAKALLAQTGEVVSTIDSIQSGLDAVAPAAIQKALRAVGKDAGEKLASQLAQELARRASIAVDVSGLGAYSALEDLTKFMIGLSGVEDVVIRSFQEGNAELEMMTPGTNANEVASAIGRSRKSFSVNQIESNRLRLTYQQEKVSP
jgi:hypothetical protein